MTTCGHCVFAFLAGTRSASSLSFHFIRNISSPDVSVAPMIFSGTSPRSKPSLRSFFRFASELFLASSAFRFFAASDCAEMGYVHENLAFVYFSESKLKQYHSSSSRCPRTHWSALHSPSSLRAPMYCHHRRSPSTSGSIRPAKVTVYDEISVMSGAIEATTISPFHSWCVCWALSRPNIPRLGLPFPSYNLFVWKRRDVNNLKS